MLVLNLLLKRRGVLYEAYRLSGESQHFYRLQEVEYLIRKCKDDQDRGPGAFGLDQRGDGHPRVLGDPGTVDYG
jgi:hypothetical protein